MSADDVIAALYEDINSRDHTIAKLHGEIAALTDGGAMWAHNAEILRAKLAEAEARIADLDVMHAELDTNDVLRQKLEASEARVKELRQEAQHKEACCRDLSRRNEELKAELAIVTVQRDAREEELVTRMVEETEVPHE